MTGEHARGHRFDRIAVADVAELDLRADLLRDRTEAILAPGDEDAFRPAPRAAGAVASPIPDDAPVTIRDALNVFTVPG